MDASEQEIIDVCAKEMKQANAKNNDHITLLEREMLELEFELEKMAETMKEIVKGMA